MRCHRPTATPGVARIARRSGGAATCAPKVITVGVVNDGAWEGDDSIPPAPVPRHEREWRHPSELGRPELATFETRSVSRAALAVAGLTGVALSLVLGRMLIPSGGGNTTPIAEPASSTIRPVPVTLVIPSSRGVPTTIKPPEPEPTVLDTVEPATTPTPPPTGEAVPQTVTEPSLATLASPEPSIGAAVVSIGGTEHLGVLWNGRYAIATAGAGDLGATVSLLLADGSTLDSIVVAQDAGLVLLELVEPTHADEVSAAWPPEGATRYIGTDGSISPVDVVPGDDGTYLLRDSATTEQHSTRQGTPVIDSQGRLVGMCAPISDGSSTLVSWIPVEALIDRADQLGAWLGIRSGPEPTGPATIAEVAPGAPAEAAGLMVGDVVTAIDGRPVGSLSELGGRLRVISPGTTVTLTVQRSDAEITLVITTAGRPKVADSNDD